MNNDSRPKSYFKIDRVWRKGHIIILWRSTTQRGPPGGQYEPPTTQRGPHGGQYEPGTTHRGPPPPVPPPPLTHRAQGQRSISPQVITKAWRPPLQCRQWSVHCLGDTNTCGIRFDLTHYKQTTPDLAAKNTYVKGTSCRSTHKRGGRSFLHLHKSAATVWQL